MKGLLSQPKCVSKVCPACGFVASAVSVRALEAIERDHLYAVHLLLTRRVGALG